MKATFPLLVAAFLLLSACDRYTWLVVSEPTFSELVLSDDEPVSTLIVTGEASKEGRLPKARTYALTVRLEFEARHYQGCTDDCDLRVDVHGPNGRSRSVHPDPGFSDHNSIDLPLSFDDCPVRQACASDLEVELEFVGEGLVEVDLAGIFLLNGHGERNVSGEELGVRIEVVGE